MLGSRALLKFKPRVLGTDESSKLIDEKFNSFTGCHFELK